MLELKQINIIDKKFFIVKVFYNLNLMRYLN